MEWNTCIVQNDDFAGSTPAGGTNKAGEHCSFKAEVVRTAYGLYSGTIAQCCLGAANKTCMRKAA